MTPDEIKVGKTYLDRKHHLTRQVLSKSSSVFFLQRGGGYPNCYLLLPIENFARLADCEVDEEQTQTIKE